MYNEIDIQRKIRNSNDPQQYISIKPDDCEYIIRPRINALLGYAVEHFPLVIVCAGMGYGKTRAVSDFISESRITTVWVQLSELDNIGTHFWGNFTRACFSIDESITKDFIELGFPDTDDKLNQFTKIRDLALPNQRIMLILDDIHLVNNPEVIRFIECILHNNPTGMSIILICRKIPSINIWDLESKGYVSSIYEKDLNFTENELDIYMSRQGLSLEPQTLHEIFQDTNGWAFSVNLVARSIKKAPGYSGYVRSAIKQNVLRLIGSVVWDQASERLKHLLARISLINHLSADLVSIFTAGDNSTLIELERYSAFVRFDNNTNAYLIHHLFLDFLHTKQELLEDNEIYETYKAAADWCRQNRYTVDALGLFEKVKDYESIVSIFLECLLYIQPDLAQCFLGIIERAPSEIFDKVNFFAVMHVSCVNFMGYRHEFFTLAAYYEQKYLQLPENSMLRNNTLAGLYYFWGNMRFTQCTIEDRNDFLEYYIKAIEYLVKSPSKMVQLIILQIGPWFSPVGSSRQGAIQECIENVISAVKLISPFFKGLIGCDNFAMGEMLFYQGDVKTAERLFLQTIGNARENRQFEVINRSLFYLMRIAIFHGNRIKAEQALKDMELQMSEEQYSLGYNNYDIAVGWYNYMLRQPDRIPDWLKKKFSPYPHAYFIINFGNQMKARYHYMTKNHSPLLAYIDEMKQRESVLYGRVEMLSIEACVRYKMRDREMAFTVLKEAYETASPNGIVMPFIELGNDMRTLTGAALHEPDCGIPNQWLKVINYKSALYAKQQALVISAQRREDDNIALTAREREILLDLYNGLTRSEIAVKQDLSINTVKTFIKDIFQKMNAKNIADAIRIAVEHKLV